MDRPELESLTAEYIDTCVRGAAEQERLRKLFLGGARNSFISLWEEYGGDYGIAVRETVKAYSSDKGKAVERFKGLTEYLERRTAQELHVDWPPVDVSSRLDRLIYMMKALQTQPPDAVQFLSDKLWLSTRTIEQELSAIQYENMAQPLGFLDQSLVISGIRRAHGSVSFLSSVHPMLLMENLTSVVVMIEALLEKANQPAYRDWAMVTASHVWNQLTDYARARVTDVMSRTYDDDSPVPRLFEKLKAMPPDSKFRSEAEIARDALDVAMYCFKAGESCKISCRERDGSLSEHIGIPVYTTGTHADDVIRLRRDDGVEETIPLSTIAKSERIKT